MADQQRVQETRIVVFATDPRSETFREDTSTLAIAPDWARIRLRHRITPGAPLIVFNVENGRQAEFVVDGASGPNEVTIRLTERSTDIWQLEQPEPVKQAEEPQDEQALRELEEALSKDDDAGTAAAAQARRDADENAQRAEAQAAVEAAFEAARQAQARVAEQARNAESVQREALNMVLRAARLMKSEVDEMVHRVEVARGLADTLARKAEEACAEAEAAGLELEACRAAERAADEKLAEARLALQRVGGALADVTKVVTEAEPAGVPLPLEPKVEPLNTGPISWDDRRANRRVYVKTRARIRHDDDAEVVQPQDVSRRGLSFQSSTPYELNAVVWVALHYQDGTVDLLETPSRVVRVTHLDSEASAFSYGLKFEN